MTAEFVLAGHSHTWSMGPPLGYQGPRTLLPAEAFGRTGFHLMEENGAGRTDAYWDELVAAAPGRDAVLVWNGNQHWQFLLEQRPAFDLFDPQTPDLAPAASVLPRRMVCALFEPSIAPLRTLMAQLNQAGARSITTVGTPPPPADMSSFAGLIRGSEFFRFVARQQGVDLDTVALTPVAVLLKLWRVMQSLVADATAAAGGRFVAVPACLLDEAGYLGRDYHIGHDFTHAAAPFGQLMFRMALHPEETEHGPSL